MWLQVLLPYNPWDTGTSRTLMRNASSDAEVCAPTYALCSPRSMTVLFVQAMRQLLEDTGADGYNGDTMVRIVDGCLTRVCWPL